MKTKKNPEPLLYIQQPEIDFPEPDMQEIFMSKKTKGNSQSNETIQRGKNGAKTNFMQTVEISDLLPESEKVLDGTEVLTEVPENKSDELPEVISQEGMDMNEESEKSEIETMDLHGNHDELQEMLAQYEMKRQFEKEVKPLLSKKNQTVCLKRVKGFKEMNIDEKLEYLVNFPKLLPPVPCIFTTGNRSIRGFLLSRMEEVIEMKTFDEKHHKILINELRNIQMIGLK